MQFRKALYQILTTLVLVLCGNFIYGQIDSLKEQISYYKETDQKEKMIQTEIELGREYVFFHDEIEKGVKTLNHAIESAETFAFPHLKARGQHLLGYTYINIQNDYENGLKLYFEALEHYEKNPDYERHVTLIINLAETYYYYRSYDEAIKFLFEGVDLATKNKDYETLAMIHNNLGANYNEMKEVRTAIRYWTLAANYFKEQGNDFGYYQTKVNIINSRRDSASLVNNAKENLEVFEKAIPIFMEAGADYAVVICKKNLATIYNALGEYDKSKKILKELILLEDGFDDIEVKAETFSSLAVACKGLGEYKEQAMYLELYQELSDSLFENAKAKAIAETRTKYQAEKIENENNLLRQKEEVQEAKLENERLTKYSLVVGLGLIILFAIFVANRFYASQKQNKIIETQKKEVDQAYDHLEAKNKEVLDSINYAKRIQAAILPSDQLIKEHLPDSFVLYKPKDIVAGDFYWLETTGEQTLFAVADCTGHGVPGAMVSVVCNNGLNRAVREHGLDRPSDILNKTRDIVVSEFEKSSNEVKDGMDISLLSVKKSAKDAYTIAFSGANNPLWLVRKESYEVEEIKGDKQPIGRFADSKPFNLKELQVTKGDTIYIFSDGYADQFGGVAKRESGKKLKSKNFKNLIVSIQELSMTEQEKRLDEFFETWKGDLEQLDDVCVMGVRF